MSPDINNFKTQIKTDIEKSGWNDILNPFIDSKAFEDVFNSLVSLVNNDQRFTPPFKYILKALEDEDADVDLRRWANQGVLLINTALTVEINKIGSHFWHWKPFTEYLFYTLNKKNKDIVFILMGKKAEAWQLLLSNHKLLKCSHPASAAYRGGIWDSNDVFNKANKELKVQNKALIIW